MYDIIKKKRDGYPLTKEEISFFVDGYTKGDIPDEQASALCMAIYFQGMTAEETTALTMTMAHSGDMTDLSAIPGCKIDKHSSGGVGDKTTLIVAPIVAACGVPVAKMSGRGLGHTGGTIDKLESIPGFQTSISSEEFFRLVSENGLSVVGQSGHLAPADKKLYALRDVTATIESLPLIASSIMSKKLASGADGIVLDVKIGSGSFNKTYEQGLMLAEAMVDIGTRAGRQVMAVLSDMDKPLGHAIGNAIEVIEAIELLHNQGDDDLRTLCTELAASMLYLAKKDTLENCRHLAVEKLSDGSAFRAFRRMVEAQGGDVTYIDNPSSFVLGTPIPVLSEKEGFISQMDTEAFGRAALLLGAGRTKKEDAVDHGAGILVRKKTGDYVTCGETVAIMYVGKEGAADEAAAVLQSALSFQKNPVNTKPIVLGSVLPKK